MKRLVLVLSIMGIALTAWGLEDYWAQRNTIEGARRGYEAMKALYQQQTASYEVAWKFARAAHHYADNFVQNRNQKRTILTEGRDAAERATRLNPNSPEGWYWVGVCLGAWGEVNGIMQSLGAVRPIMDAIARGMRINANFDRGAFYVLRGRVFHKAPPVISVGDRRRAEADYRQAIEINPRNRTAHRFYAELLVEDRRMNEARVIIEQGLAIPHNAESKVLEDKETQLLQRLREQL